MNRGLPADPTDMELPEIRTNAPAFFGYEEWETGRPTERHRVTTFNGGNIVTLNGGDGPWLARQLTGEYVGVLAVHWLSPRAKDSADILARALGYETQQSDTNKYTSTCQDKSGDVLVDYLFGHADPLEEIPEDLEVRNPL